jgi:acyl-homoserine lactone acylase PvdQ
LDLLSDFQGSNAFVIDGNYTVNEKPLFAADPHLDNSMPS